MSTQLMNAPNLIFEEREMFSQYESDRLISDRITDFQMTKTYYFCLVPTLHSSYTYHIQIAKFQNAVLGDDIYTLDIWGTFFITNLVFWSIGSIYCYFDVTTTPKFLRKYKIQPETNEPVDPKKFKNLIWTVFLNQTVVYIPLRFTRSHQDYVNKNLQPIHLPQK